MLECVYVGDTGMQRMRTGMDPGARTRKESPSFPKIRAVALGGERKFYISLLLISTSFDDISA